MDNYEAVLDFFRKADKPVSAGQIATGTGIGEDRFSQGLLLTRLSSTRGA